MSGNSRKVFDLAMKAGFCGSFLLSGDEIGLFVVRPEGDDCLPELERFYELVMEECNKISDSGDRLIR